MNTCPYCRTENEPGAVRCRHCTSWMAQPPLQREWYRARNDRMIAGVCRGLANRFGIPVTVSRLVFILSILAGGWGIILYLALWVAMPLEPLALPAPPMQPPAPAPLVTPPPHQT